MVNNYICVCGYLKFLVHEDGTISCARCGRQYTPKPKENAQAFNKRVRKKEDRKK